jgi:hypothetical protein
MAQRAPMHGSGEDGEIGDQPGVGAALAQLKAWLTGDFDGVHLDCEAIRMCESREEFIDAKFLRTRANHLRECLVDSRSWTRPILPVEPDGVAPA